MKPPAANLPEGHGSVYKEVRFSPTSTPLRRAQSVSGSNPSANSRYVQTPVYGRNFPVLDTSYIDQSRELLEKQRANFQAERELFAQERRLWETERSLLKARIAELESVKSPRAHSNTAVPRSAGVLFGAPQLQGSRDTFLHSAQVWEGTSPGGRPTRVFLNEETPESLHLSTINEGSDNKPPSLDAALSPQARAADAPGVIVSVPVPIEKLDSRLDGITLKSTGLPPGVVARVITPPSPSPLTTSSPASSDPARPDMEHRNSLKLKLSELGPPNENLVRDAGHTPMVIIEADGSRRSTQDATPAPEAQCQEEAPLAPVHTEIGLPTENAESYFPDLPEDPALKGPLGLTNDEEHDNSFLNELDQKLLDQARRILGSSEETAEPNETEHEKPSQGQGEQEPEFKFKNSTNFGTAFGRSNCGKF
ncbi:uncharacterized protein N7503_011149 [Penicillium pulvis]|uniref:uncharacterized protein n=1 Tax=Penicillium pulvis TaxID=1562058 RepID=UPI002546821C|nr:uncharacterized protein N7503_011149 [Penicillium pulvis]KAJ5785937.1 hypothetical protein N7503_011149 [Penicillium pulvis]